MTSKLFKAADSELANATAFIEEELEKIECPINYVMKMTVCLEEIFVNIAHYGYPNGDGDVLITVDYQNGMFSIVLEDEGIAFNPLEHTDPDVTLPIDELPIGGLGIFMVKKTMDELSYERIGSRNVFTMKKKL